MMSHNQPYRYNNESSARFQQPSASSSQLELEDKPYDLTDDYNPYSYPSQQQTFNADAQKMFSNNHNRRPSIPLHLATKDSFDKSDDVVQPAYPPTAPQASDADNISFWQRILPDSLACRLFVLTVILETIVDLAIEGELLIRVHEEKKLVEGQTPSTTNIDNIDTNADVAERSMQSYLALFAVAHVFQLLMACHAVYTRNTLQFMFLIALNALFLVAALVQIKEVKETLADAAGIKGVTSIPINVLTSIIPAVIALAEIAYIALGWRIYNEFGWQVFKFLGADRRIKKMYAKFQIYECLIKFDFFFFAAFSIELIYLVLDKTDWEYYVTIVALPLSLILLLEGHLAARHESKMMMITFMIGCVGAMVYFVYKLAKVLLLKDADHIFHFTWKTLTVFAIFAIMLLFATFVFSMMVIQNFGRGLKESLVKKDAVQSSSIHRRNQSQNLYRMSIG